MKKLTIYSIAFLALFFTLTYYVHAQHPVLNLVDWNNGNFRSGNIIAIDQDEQGFIWLASYNGLHRYDGHNYISYYNDPEDSSSLAANRHVSMCISKSGIIWLGLWNNGLDRFDPATQTFTHFQHNPADSSSISNNTIVSLLEDNEGKLWVGSHNGLNLFHPESGSFTRFHHIPGDTTSLSNNQVRVIYQDRQNTIWVGTGSPWGNESGPDEGGLNRFLHETATFTRYMHDPENSNSLLDNKVRAILEDSRGNFWVGTKGDGLHTMNRETGKFIRHTYDPKHPNKLSRAPIISNFTPEGVTFIHEDATGTIWIGTFGSGLSRYDPNTKRTVHYTNKQGNPIGLKDNFLWWAFTSQEGVLWMSTFRSDGNIYKTDPLLKSFEYLPIGARTIGMLEDNVGNLWICTNKGLRVYKSIHAKVRNTDLENQLPVQLKNEYQISILQDEEGSIWIGSVRGLWQKDAKTGKFNFFSHDPNNANSISEGAVSTLFVDSKSVLWVGTRGGGLNRWEPKTNTFSHFRNDIDNSESISSNNILSICEDKLGNIWIGYGGNGVSKLNKKSGSFKHYFGRVKTGIVTSQSSQITAHDMMLDNNGVLWLGFNRGLYFYDEKSDELVVFKDSITGKQILNRVIGINQDKEQNIWVMGSSGLHKLNSKRVLAASYGRERGIDPRGFTFNSNYTTKNGKVFFGDATGFYSFVPQELKRNSTPAQISFLDFRLFDKSVIPSSKSPLAASINETEKIELAYNQNVFTLEFAAIHFTNPAQNQQLFMLENYDNTWINPEQEFMASYYNVPPGNYVFRIKAASSEGVWAEKSIHIIIHPPWYNTLWAYILYAFIFIAGVWVVHNFQRRRVIRAERARTQQKELAQAKEIEKAYTELKSTQSQLIQSEKMASLGELTAGIAHEIQNPLNFVNNFSEVSKELAEELKDEAQKPKLDGSVISELAEDIVSNQEKIHHHGQRASNIVKGMLEHSRTSDGKKELTDINALADEYLRLAYHGLRAKDKSFNADFKTDFDETLPKIKLIPQDIGRVLLNLINNAFFAVNQKTARHSDPEHSEGVESGVAASHEGYKPEVIVSTEKLDGHIEISVKDNGEGIPEQVRDKIFQPFFTTKPTGSGTGLGLSLSYDIVKAHGGEIKVESKESMGTEFIISFPIV